MTAAFGSSLEACVARFQTYQLPPVPPELQEFPATKRAAVLILLFELNNDGIIRVLLTTRSKLLRSHPGQTALPGGKADASDKDDIATALREANEEINLPLQCPDIQILASLRPFLSLYKLMVTPIVAVLHDTSILSSLKPQEAEVDHIFHHPLEALLDPDIIPVLQPDCLAEKGGVDWPYETDWHNTSDANWLQNSTYRMHRFRTTHTPIKGLTSDILIHAAEVAYGRKTTYERYAADQLDFMTAITIALSDLNNDLSNGVAGMSKEHKQRLVEA